MAQQLPPPPKVKPIISRILFIFDASNSMNGTWEKESKIGVARKILISLLDSLEKLDNIEMALRVYGHQKPVPPQDCSDSKLEVPFGQNNASKIRQKLRFIEPQGTTPMAGSLALAVNDFGNKTDCRNIIILITDGIEACDGDPCAVSRDLQAKGIALRPFIIGIGIDENFKESFNCIGKYYNAKKEEQFKEILNVVITQALNSTTAQVNLLDIYGKPTETNVDMTFYDFYSNKLKANYMHTMNHRGNPDTIVLDPLVTYRMTVFTIPPVQKDSFKLTPGKHNIIAIDAPQGDLIIKADIAQGRNVTAIIRKAGSMSTLNYQDLNRSERYIIGNYDIEIPVLPKILLYNVEIKQSSTTTIQVPQPGLVTFLMTTPGYGNLFLREKNKDLQWIYNLNTALRNETLYLQPGSYTLVFRALYAKQTVYTLTRMFDVTSGASKVVELY
ncbi:MAG TPA: vWA domain-containing protein [Bacteroidales bacterium]